MSRTARSKLQFDTVVVAEETEPVQEIPPMHEVIKTITEADESGEFKQPLIECDDMLDNLGYDDNLDSDFPGLPTYESTSCFPKKAVLSELDETRALKRDHFSDFDMMDQIETGIRNNNKNVVILSELDQTKMRLNDFSGRGDCDNIEQMETGTALENMGLKSKYDRITQGLIEPMETGTPLKNIDVQRKYDGIMEVHSSNGNVNRHPIEDPGIDICMKNVQNVSDLEKLKQLSDFSNDLFESDVDNFNNIERMVTKQQNHTIEASKDFFQNSNKNCENKEKTDFDIQTLRQLNSVSDDFFEGNVNNNFNNTERMVSVPKEQRQLNETSKDFFENSSSNYRSNVSKDSDIEKLKQLSDLSNDFFGSEEPISTDELLFQKSILSKTPTAKKPNFTDEEMWAASPTVNTKSAKNHVQSMFSMSFAEDESLFRSVNSAKEGTCVAILI